MDKNKENLKQFYLLPKIINGGIAGMIGVTCVFPIDLVKTRLQNQVIGPKGEKQYKNIPKLLCAATCYMKTALMMSVLDSRPDKLHDKVYLKLDCFVKTYKSEGFLGMYRGAAVNIFLITPEKAIKLASFDYFRHHLTKPDGSQPLGSCIARAGAMAGFCQVIITTPMELLKIQMQDEGRIMAQKKKEGKPHVKLTARSVAMKIYRERGFFGLYRGISATLVRDIYFSVVYFPVFFFVNDKGKDEVLNRAPAWWTFISGSFGGMMSALAVNPFDVVKTRLQTMTKGKTDMEYNGMIDCFRKTYHYEGINAFLKGIGCRIAVVAPLFGIAQTMYYVGLGTIDFLVYLPA